MTESLPDEELLPNIRDDFEKLGNRLFESTTKFEYKAVKATRAILYSTLTMTNSFGFLRSIILTIRLPSVEENIPTHQFHIAEQDIFSANSRICYKVNQDGLRPLQTMYHVTRQIASEMPFDSKFPDYLHISYDSRLVETMLGDEAEGAHASVAWIYTINRDGALIKVQTPHGDEKVGSCSLEELRRMPGVGTAIETGGRNTPSDTGYLIHRIGAYRDREPIYDPGTVDFIELCEGVEHVKGQYFVWAVVSRGGARARAIFPSIREYLRLFSLHSSCQDFLEHHPHMGLRNTRQTTGTNNATFLSLFAGNSLFTSSSNRGSRLEEEPESVEMVPLEIGNEQQVKAYYESAFITFQEANCLSVVKAYIKLMESHETIDYSYNDDDEKGTPKGPKPGWWPKNLIYRGLDSQTQAEQICLLIHIFRELGDTYGITADKLAEAGRDVRPQIKPRKRLDILDELYKVRRAEESYKRGEIEIPPPHKVYGLVRVIRSDFIREIQTNPFHTWNELRESLVPLPGILQYRLQPPNFETGISQLNRSPAAKGIHTGLYRGRAVA
ncbi:hypothetical protein MGYG_05719 [Nannizzia gypsea CBS 118893]|uniref:Subtelomeric hrmA-associated cluster protein AFUB-079030/YDR124W-like helical bundle domain-containing protein n=1 Tax=Arthroderma gypseum (strain ATCC MYA-4604 / CBS 118893) TaxID=535722 RepID=E4UXI7_ARTGP|nr:hypothetical protein MGYG_05719 [Nannizzia gypsea CBS 118893]EFR02721.1 hypothetical protein MGYG_05719 [Nannizzia gypsea CBS 118893]